MFKLYMGYLRENANNTVIKIGKTIKTCWSRCKKEDYLIYQAVCCFDIDTPNGLCDFLEAAMIFEYRNRYPTFKGNEYFYIENQSKEEIEKEWCDIIDTLIKQYCSKIDKNFWVWYKGEVSPYTY